MHASTVGRQSGSLLIRSFPDYYLPPSDPHFLLIFTPIEIEACLPACLPACLFVFFLNSKKELGLLIVTHKDQQKRRLLPRGLHFQKAALIA